MTDPVPPKPLGGGGSADYYEFGPFRLEVSTRSLYRDGHYVAVTPKAFDTLLLLVEEAGRVVTKDELMQRVWPDAFVEEGSIANNISLLRKILNGDFGAEGPIATISRRGYRFTAPVTLRNAAAGIAVVAESGPMDVEAIKAIEAFDSAHPIPSERPTRNWFAAIAVGLVVLVAAIVGIAVLRVTPTEANSGSRAPRRAVAVLSMKNVSGDDQNAWFSTALAEAINTELNTGGELRIISGAAVAQMQRELSAQPGVGLSRKQLDEIGRNLGCDLILSGNYLHAKDRIRIDLRVDDIATGKTVASLSAEEADDKLLDLVVEATRELRTRLGLAAPLPGQANALRATLSSDPTALRYYFLGLEALRNLEISRSIELLTQAIAADPDFALAHSVLSTSWRVLGYDDKSKAAAKRAFDLSPRLGREDQLLVQGAYYSAMGDVPKAAEKFQALWNFFPDNIAYGLRLTHQQLLGGRLEEARRTLDEMRALPPPADTDPRVDEVESSWYFRKAQYADALRVATAGAEKSQRRKSNQQLAIMTMTQGSASMRLGDLDRAHSYIANAQQLYEQMGDTGGAADAMRADAEVLERRGELDAALQKLDRALEIAVGMNHSRLMTTIRIARSNLSLKLGKFAVAKSDAEAALTSARELNNPASIAQALFALGSVEDAQGNAASARSHLEEAQRLSRDIGEPLVSESRAVPAAPGAPKS